MGLGRLGFWGIKKPAFSNKIIFKNRFNLKIWYNKFIMFCNIKDLVFVTGNAKKLKEYQQILGDDLKSKDIDLDEIQSDKIEEVALNKAKKACEILKKPIIVEDVSFSLDEFKGLPGPFIKFFEKKFPKYSLVKMLGQSENRKGYAEACIAYFDGEKEFTVSGKIFGNIAYKAEDDDGFGFDSCFIPEGYDKTMSQLGKEIKNQISHRAKAIKALKEMLEKENS